MTARPSTARKHLRRRGAVTTAAAVVPTRRRERGVVLPLTAMMIIPLLIISAFSIDLGSWYAQTSRMQRAADAAALAGVVWMPDEPAAESAARAAATRNGFTDGVDGVEVNVGFPGSRQVSVEIKADGHQWFSQLAIDAPRLDRDATAEYVLPVPLGSPDNRFGNDPTTGFTPNLWAAISGPYTNKGQGDIFATTCGSGEDPGCSTSGNEFDENGYVYAIDVKPADVGKTMVVEIYDAGYYGRGLQTETGDAAYNSGAGVNTEYELFRADNTPLSWQDNLTRSDDNLADTGSCTGGSPGRFRIAAGASASTYKNKWVTLCRIVANKSGQWILRVRSSGIPGMSDSGNATNQYSLRASYTTGTSKPAIYGIEDISMFNNLASVPNGQTSATFYLAEVEARHAGKTFRISLWDPGDGQSGDYDINILLPGGTNTSCRYGARGGSVSTSANCSIVTRSGGSNQYNAKWLDIDISIPSNYSCNPDCWWTVRYDFTAGSAPTDRTVWTAQIVGDPVHLVE